MDDYCVYVRGFNKDLWWVKSFYASRYKDNRGAYKAANRFAKLMHEKTGSEYVVVRDEK